ncbi:MAG: hypothetical protein FWH52_05940 [Synergistaceae bacterium]|nr:hypothetical protein [Synergistaceae bacterium]
MVKKMFFTIIKVTVICVIICVLVLAVLFIIINKDIRIGPVISIDDNAYTAKQMVEISDDYVKKYVRIKNLYLSNIQMHLDENHRGEVIMTYSYEKNGRYKSYEVNMSSQDHMVNSLYYIERSSTTSKSFMNFHEWMIDSDEALDIALKTFQDYGYEVDVRKVWIDARMRAKQEYSWNILIEDTTYRNKYGVGFGIFVDAFTGEVSGFEPIYEAE